MDDIIHPHETALEADQIGANEFAHPENPTTSPFETRCLQEMVKEEGLGAAAAQLRHKSMNSTLRYIRASVEEQKEALERTGKGDQRTRC